MTTLVIAEAYPWPAVDGYKLRLSNMIAGLLLRGPVDFLCLDGSGRARDAAPAGVRVIDAPEGPELSIRAWGPTWLRSTDPRRLLRRDFGEARRVLADLDMAAYDVTFFSHVDSWYRTYDLVPGPAILDFDNLEDLLMAGIRRMGPAIHPGDSAAARAREAARWTIGSGFDLVDERRWRDVQLRAAATVDRVAVCSEIDIERSGCANAVELPNGYELGWTPADHIDVAAPNAPVFLFVGLLGYQPNIDAARWFATDILPIVRRSLPGARFRIVGRHAESVQGLGALDGVEVVGDVASLEPELTGADVSVVPLRSGAGTRLKVVEAMANRLPVVSTSIGCEGIDVDRDVHLLVADDAAAFAAACVRMSSDRAIRERIIEAGAARYEERYRWDAIRDHVRELADEVAAGGTRANG